MRKHPSNFIGIIDIIEMINKYRKCFFKSLLKLRRKFEEKWVIFPTNFLIFRRKFCGFPRQFLEKLSKNY